MPAHDPDSSYYRCCGGSVKSGASLMTWAELVSCVLVAVGTAAWVLSSGCRPLCFLLGLGGCLLHLGLIHLFFHGLKHRNPAALLPHTVYKIVQCVCLVFLVGLVAYDVSAVSPSRSVFNPNRMRTKREAAVEPPALPTTTEAYDDYYDYDGGFTTEGPWVFKDQGPLGDFKDPGLGKDDSSEDKSKSSDDAYYSAEDYSAYSDNLYEPLDDADYSTDVKSDEVESEDAMESKEEEETDVLPEEYEVVGEAEETLEPEDLSFSQLADAEEELEVSTPYTTPLPTSTAAPPPPAPTRDLMSALLAQIVNDARAEEEQELAIAPEFDRWYPDGEEESQEKTKSEELSVEVDYVYGTWAKKQVEPPPAPRPSIEDMSRPTIEDEASYYRVWASDRRRIQTARVVSLVVFVVLLVLSVVHSHLLVRTVQLVGWERRRAAEGLLARAAPISTLPVTISIPDKPIPHLSFVPPNGKK